MHNFSLSNALQAIFPVSEGLQNYINANTTRFSFARGSQLPNIYPINRTMYFIDCGLVCGTRCLEEETQTLWFADERSFIIPNLVAPSVNFTDRFEFLKPTVLMGLDIQKIVDAIDRFPELKILGITILDRYIHAMHQREILLRLPSHLRYANAFAQHPNLFIDSNTDHLASYLNLSNRQFARLKKNFHQRRMT
jgi:hypothetical protein